MKQRVFRIVLYFMFRNLKGLLHHMGTMVFVRMCNISSALKSYLCFTCYTSLRLVFPLPSENKLEMRLASEIYVTPGMKSDFNTPLSIQFVTIVTTCSD